MNTSRSAQSLGTEDEADYDYDLGTYSRPVSTSSSLAQRWFDRGLQWSYAFNHEESAICFLRASTEDPSCAMVFWGLAYALGPNYNKPWEAFDADEREANLRQAKESVNVAAQLAKKADSSPTESAVIMALQARYPQDRNGDDYAKWNVDYADAMRDVYNEHGSDLDVAALYADALMNITPWNLWDIRTGEPAKGSRTIAAKAVLDRAFTQPSGKHHPGLLHLWCHLMEMSANPEDALPIANNLRGLCKDAGHLNHMPTHLDVLAGKWQDAIDSNTQAIQADERYLARAGALNFYSLYRSHNYHFKVYAAMFAAQYKTALDTVALLEQSLPEDLLRKPSPPMADWLESFLSMRVHVLIRFGKWEDILALLLPKDPELYAVTTAIIRYGRGVAYAAIGNIEEATTEQKSFQDSAAAVPATRTLFNNTANDILLVAAAMLEGELEYRKGHFEIAFLHLRKAVELSDNLPYDEPWGWMQPPRHALGALLLEQGHVREAAQEYKADLGLDESLPRALRHPNNIWAMVGYHECLSRLGEETEAGRVQLQLDELSGNTDVGVVSSCYCRTGASKL
ncbi:Putative tetratricopeptide-like helical domain superfamily [Septoria linicola]|uniref:Tetratricopeptide-like helical domain superfamily n=1 Tax=Septoria linicola TaxID=215465 RepID=A0A9Q9AJT8_9PEZI|nr:putative tetratricopeptide-like helical domain superfamily [Septoria linicola]USW47241.1 Putative tetratricopeptide-like helical domain superfamily [Septoria linicola]